MTRVSDDAAAQAEVIAGNARYWEALAPHRPGAPDDELRALRVLGEPELAAFGDVRGRRCLQVAASVGDESLQLALMGADVTAVDLAPGHVATGRAKAARLGLTVDFRVGDMTALPEDLVGFDVVHVSWGGLCWAPDVDAWAAAMAGRLRSGGRLVIAEHHPLWEALGVAGADALRLTRSYVDPSWIAHHDPAKAPVVTRDLGEPAGATAYVWNLGAVVSAVLAAGLRLTSLREDAEPALYEGFSQASHLPATYVLTARKD